MSSATGEEPLHNVGDRVQIRCLAPVCQYRVPRYLRGKTGTIESIIKPVGIDNEEEGFGRNAGHRRHYYRLLFPMRELWPAYAGRFGDEPHIEVFETWLERTSS